MENIEVLLQSTIKLKSEVKQEQNIIHGGFSEEFRDEKHFVQGDAAHQQAPHAQGPYGKITPPGVGQMQVMPSPAMKRPLGQKGPVGHHIPMDPSANPRCPTNPPHQQNPRPPSSQMKQQQQQVQVPPQQQVIGVICRPSHIGPRPDIRAQQPGTNDGIGAAGDGGNAPGNAHNRKHVFRQLITALKSNAACNQAEILLILKSNPLLYKEFLKREEERQLSLAQNLKGTPLLLMEFIKRRREWQLSQAQNRNQVNTGQGTGGVMVPDLQQQ